MYVGLHQIDAMRSEMSFMHVCSRTTGCRNQVLTLFLIIRCFSLFLDSYVSKCIQTQYSIHIHSFQYVPSHFVQYSKRLFINKGSSYTDRRILALHASLRACHHGIMPSCCMHVHPIRYFIIVCLVNWSIAIYYSIQKNTQTSIQIDICFFHA